MKIVCRERTLIKTPILIFALELDKGEAQNLYYLMDAVTQDNIVEKYWDKLDKKGKTHRNIDDLHNVALEILEALDVADVFDLEP